MQLLLQFYSDSFETLQELRSWSENGHITWILPSDVFCQFFYRMKLVIIPSEENGYICTRYLEYATPSTV